MVPDFRDPLHNVAYDVTITSKIPENVTSLLIDLELRDEEERVPRDQRSTLVSIFIVLGHWLTSEVRLKLDKMTTFEW